MKKKLDTRFSAPRIKKIMQTDEDIGKMAMAVPLLVSKALELFLQDLCNQTYKITVERGARTMSSLHLKQCVQSSSVFDFLKDVVIKVPDFGCSDAGGEDIASKRRKVMDADGNVSDEETKQNRNEVIKQSNTDRGRGRGRPRGRGRGARAVEHEAAVAHNVDTEKQHQGNNSVAVVRNFDLNMNLDENGETITAFSASPVDVSVMNSMTKNEESPTVMNNLQIDSFDLSLMHGRRLDDEEEEEDYDEEDYDKEDDG